MTLQHNFAFNLYHKAYLSDVNILQTKETRTFTVFLLFALLCDIFITFLLPIHFLNTLRFGAFQQGKLLCGVGCVKKQVRYVLNTTQNIIRDLDIGDKNTNCSSCFHKSDVSFKIMILFN